MNTSKFNPTAQYTKAWTLFSQSPEFTRTVEQMHEYSGINRDHIEHGIRTMFDAGWNAKTSAILDTMLKMNLHLPILQ